MIRLYSNNISNQTTRNFVSLTRLLLFGFFIFSPFFWRGAGGEASAQVTANFSASPVAGCPPLPVQFTDMSTGGPTSWNWNFGNSGTSVLPNPNVIYNLPGVYTVTLTVSDGTSTNTIVKPGYITVYNKPTAGFTMSTDTACVGQTVTFTDSTILSPNGAAIASWAWDFGDGNTATVTTPSITHAYNTLTTPHIYPISLIITDINGCTNSIIHNIVIVSPPTPSFSADSTFSCTPPLHVTFTNNSSYSGQTTYHWNFGDGTNSTAFNPPSHTYTASGTYNVTLILNQNGCIDSLVKPNYIVIQNMAASFAATPTVVCTGQPITFNNTSVPAAATANWNFGDAGTSNLPSPSHTYTTAGTYTVTLIAGANTCLDTTTGTVTVNQTPVASFIADTMVSCAVPFTVNFTSTSTGGTNYVWNFGDGSPASVLQNPAHVYTQPGTYTVSLIVTNASGPCVDSVKINNFIVISRPVAGFTHLPDSGCAPLTVNFMSTSTSTIEPITTYIWNFGDGNNATVAVPGTSHTYTATGIFTVTLIVHTANGCADTFICNNCIKVGIKPVSSFGISQDTVCYGLPISFSDSSTGNITGWYWYFGDGGSSTLQNPQYAYGDTGTFHPYLIAYNHGCADTSAIKNVVILPPVALFTYTLSCTNYYTVHFTSTSKGADSLVWYFGDGTKDSSNNKNPIHTYPLRGPYTFTLTAYNYSSGCNNSITGTFTIAEPIASFTVANTTGCYPFTANLTSTSQDANSVWWNFGDPAATNDTANITNPSYTYTATGQYPVSLIITDVNGCKDTVIDTLGALGPYPYFFADTLRGCRPLFVTFVDTSVSDSVLVQWTWDFGDGSPIATTAIDSIIHIYTTPGIYSVTMTVTDKNGCTKVLVKTNYIQPTFPYPAFTVDTFACKGDVLTFNASATNAVDGTYIWHFGDGTIDSTHNPISTITHAYTHDSLFVVTLTVRDTNGCDSTITHSVLILKPTANFRDTILNLGCGTVLDSMIDMSTGYITSWYWTFGDGGNSSSQNPKHTYTQPGYWPITLIVQNAGGCWDTVQIDSVFVPGPIGSFTFSPNSGCNPLKVCFDGNSLNAQNYLWDFGDGSAAHTADTCHTYTPVFGLQSFQTYYPLLVLGNTLPNGFQCLLNATNLTGSVTVTNVVNVSLSVPDTIHVPIDSIIPVTATYYGGVPPYTYHWSPDTGMNCDTCTSVLILGTGNTIHYTFVIYDNAGCLGIGSVVVLSEPCFQAKRIPNVFSPNGDGINDMFYIPGVCPNEKYSIQIFDRWGVLMFSTTLRNNGWDGRTNAGVEAVNGVYYFVVNINDKPYKGFVQLLR